MRQAIILADDIKRLKKAINTTKSAKLKNDYTKALTRKTEELKTYCKYKKINYKDLDV